MLPTKVLLMVEDDNVCILRCGLVMNSCYSLHHMALSSVKITPNTPNEPSLFFELLLVASCGLPLLRARHEARYRSCGGNEPYQDVDSLIFERWLALRTAVV